MKLILDEKSPFTIYFNVESYKKTQQKYELVPIVFLESVKITKRNAPGLNNFEYPSLQLLRSLKDGQVCH